MLGPDELRALGVAEVGERVQVDSSARLIAPGRIRIGSDVRIDAFCVLSAGAGGIEIGDFVHVAAFAFLAGAGTITLRDFCGISGRVSVYSSNDDYSGAALAGPTIPEELREVHTAAVTFERHALVGAGSVVLPGVRMGVGACAGALSLVRRDVPEFTIVGGVPARPIGERRRDLLEAERELRARTA